MRGSFSGPITMSATTPMTRSSVNPMSNTAASSEQKGAHRAPWLGWSERSGLLLGLALYFAVDRLARNLRCRPALGRLLAALAHAVLEAAHRAAKIRAHVAQLLGAENQHHDHEDDQPVPDAERTHLRLLFSR